MSRLNELLSKELARGRDDDALDELERLLNAYRRRPVGAWQACEIDGRPAHRRQLDCGHVEIVVGPMPRAGIWRRADGTVDDVPVGAVCHTCYRLRGDG